MSLTPLTALRLAELAAELEPPLDGPRLVRALDRPETRELLEQDRRRAARLGAHGFPWLGLVEGETVQPLARGFRPAGEVLAALEAFPIHLEQRVCLDGGISNVALDAPTIPTPVKVALGAAAAAIVICIIACKDGTNGPPLDANNNTNN